MECVGHEKVASGVVGVWVRECESMWFGLDDLEFGIWAAQDQPGHGYGVHNWDAHGVWSVHCIRGYRCWFVGSVGHLGKVCRS